MAWLASLIAEAELWTRGQVLTPEQRRATVLLWGRTLSEIGEERFRGAFLGATEASPHPPTISEIRKAAGVDPESQARRELGWLIGHMRTFGRKFKRAEVGIGAQCTVVEPPELPARIARTLLDLGFGDRQAGLDLVWEHPGLDSVRPPDHMERMGYPRRLEGDRIERKWSEAYGRTRA